MEHWEGRMLLNATAVAATVADASAAAVDTAAVADADDDAIS